MHPMTPPDVGGKKTNHLLRIRSGIMISKNHSHFLIPQDTVHSIFFLPNIVGIVQGRRKVTTGQSNDTSLRFHAAGVVGLHLLVSRINAIICFFQ